MCQISDPLSPAGHWQAAIFVAKHWHSHGFKRTDPEKLPEGLCPRSRHHRCDSGQLCLGDSNGEEQAPSGYNSFVLFSSDSDELLPRRACSSPVRYLHCKYLQSTRWLLMQSSWGSAVQPPYFPWTPVTLLTTNLNFCSSVDTLFLQLDGPSRVALVHCSTVWDTSQQQQVIQNILQGLGCHPFPSSYLIHSAHREHVGK